VISRARSAFCARDVVAAIQVAERLGPGAKVVTLMADSGLKYLSTDVYRIAG
jgi:cysteine synthase